MNQLVYTDLGLFESCDSIKDIERGMNKEKNHFYDNYKYYSDTINYTTFINYF